jgi:hypothetical protein
LRTLRIHFSFNITIKKVREQHEKNYRLYIDISIVDRFYNNSDHASDRDDGAWRRRSLKKSFE